MTKSPEQLRHAMRQMLTSYQGRGVTAIQTQPLEPEQLQQVADWQQSTSSQEPAPPQEAAVADAQRHPPQQDHAAGIPAQTPIAAPTPPPIAPAVPGHWELPVLDEAQRRSEFGALSAQVAACRKCADIVNYRHQTVFGVGNIRPRVCFMGEAPGADEDRQGEPFVGRAGQLLTKIITAMKLSRDDVYILNALKCRPPQNRTPVPPEIANCLPFVQRQLEILQPEFIVCLGAVAVRSLLGRNDAVGRLRGRFHSYGGAKVVVTYHPSYLLRQESAKRLVWDDMKMLIAEMS